MMERLFAFAFFTTPGGLIAVGLMAALILILWDWRWGLAGLFLVQWGVSNLLVQSYAVPVAWAGALLGVAGLAGVMLGMTAVQTRWHRRVPRAGNLALRLVLASLGYLILINQEVRLPLPLISPEVTTLFTWLLLTALLMFFVGDSPLHAGISLALGLIPVQAAAVILLPNPALIMVMGSGEILLILACSYLALVAVAAPSPESPPPADRPDFVPALPAPRPEGTVHG